MIVVLLQNTCSLQVQPRQNFPMSLKIVNVNTVHNTVPILVYLFQSNLNENLLEGLSFERPVNKATNGPRLQQIQFAETTLRFY